MLRFVSPLLSSPEQLRALASPQLAATLLYSPSRQRGRATHACDGGEGGGPALPPLRKTRPQAQLPPGAMIAMIAPNSSKRRPKGTEQRRLPGGSGRTAIKPLI